MLKRDTITAPEIIDEIQMSAWRQGIRPKRVTVLHVSVDIAWFLKQAKFPNSFYALLKDDSGEWLKPSAARDHLFDCLEKGWKLLPLEPCEGFDPQSGCPGHREERHAL